MERRYDHRTPRWDPDKRWLLTIDTVRAMKQQGWQPMLIARGGVEVHGTEVLQATVTAGLRAVERTAQQAGSRGLLRSLEGLNGADIVNLRSPIDPESRRVLFRSAAAVLANSGYEPFGLVGLEAMASGGVACTGCSGEDYAMPGKNALVLETNDPWEFVGLFGALRTNPVREHALRQAGQHTARRRASPAVAQRHYGRASPDAGS